MSSWPVIYDIKDFNPKMDKILSREGNGETLHTEYMRFRSELGSQEAGATGICRYRRQCTKLPISLPSKQDRSIPW